MVSSTSKTSPKGHLCRPFVRSARSKTKPGARIACSVGSRCTGPIPPQPPRRMRELRPKPAMPKSSPRHPSPRHPSPRHPNPRHPNPRHPNPRHPSPRHHNELRGRRSHSSPFCASHSPEALRSAYITSPEATRVTPNPGMLASSRLPIKRLESAASSLCTQSAQSFIPKRNS